MKLFLLLCLAAVFSSGDVHAGDTLRICTYHVLNYSLENEDGRAAQFKAIVEQIRPDILVVQDIANQDAAFNFFTAALDPQIWSLSTVHDGPGTDNMLYFKYDKLAFLDAVHHPTVQRDISEYRLHVKSTNDTLTVFSTHFTSGDNEDDIAVRDAESDVLRNRILELTGNTEYIAVCGNFNYYSAAEPGYMRLVLSAASFLSDPEGGWERNTAEWARSFTQSTRTVADGNCGGGVGGGLDDRFDFIFFSPALSERYVQGSYTVFGNDGQVRLNEAIDDPVNTAVSAEIAAALRCASDHLPVYVDVVFDTPTDVHEAVGAKLGAKVYPMPVVGQGTIELSSPVAQTLSVNVCDVTGHCTVSYEIAVEAGRCVLPLPALPAGVYWCKILGVEHVFAAPFVVVR